ncbi:cob(I)yrinic acid a,c-diamide adenosyltransferase [Facklamia sp. DSM 111018]|uniref:Corrinoid adenosyltransferase n=1 Tax=Facklamia lactis TaxID=2749967 RepID=A0ABS0LP30_9LACT|nr:cob(I)yrinic acid a,c-diamide adenosyltransferase [Facklamia lactis]MBG9980121.1 cob(I)yrinic acid a,c-diamide adenosyltransferase [Facklamia lactis]MBG9985923.1 cob(I)yrinic acid a,c-diamide adenosyltransferase [Facklamia lactis]
MQVYTRTGDKGQTRIIGMDVVPKDHIRVEAYGTIDELNSLVGVIISYPNIEQTVKEELQEIQQLLFDCGTDTATPHGYMDYRTKKEAIDWLEERIDAYSDIPAKIESFILPGGILEASMLHYARTVCRRAERCVVSFQNETESNPNVLKFLNRLSDYLFVVARLVNHQMDHQETFYERSGKVFR